jgi:hypothetical protein
MDDITVTNTELDLVVEVSNPPPVTVISEINSVEVAIQPPASVQVAAPPSLNYQVTVMPQPVLEVQLSAPGLPGAQGIQGIQGLQGEKGDTGPPSTVPGIIWGETPSGTVNGVNTAFTLANTPMAGTEQIFLNGLLLEAGAGNDYTISGTAITMLQVPVTGDRLRANYQK